MNDREASRATIQTLIDRVWNGDRLELIFDLFHERATMHLGEQALVGPDAIIEGFMMPLQTAFPDLFHVIADLFTDGDMVV